jgi:hypothetical protein
MTNTPKKSLSAYTSTMSEQGIGRILSAGATAPAGLPERIILFLENKMKAQARTRAILYCLFSAVSGVGLFISGQAALAGLQSGGTTQIFSLVFSDFQSVVANLNYFLLSLVESLPVWSLILAFIAGGILFAMVTLAVADFRKVGSVHRAFFSNHNV